MGRQVQVTKRGLGGRGSGGGLPRQPFVLRPVDNPWADVLGWCRAVDPGYTPYVDQKHLLDKILALPGLLPAQAQSLRQWFGQFKSAAFPANRLGELRAYLEKIRPHSFS